VVTADELKRAKIFSCSDRAGGFTKWEWANETRLWRLLVSFKDPDHLKKVTAMLLLGQVASSQSQAGGRPSPKVTIHVGLWRWKNHFRQPGNVLVHKRPVGSLDERRGVSSPTLGKSETMHNPGELTYNPVLQALRLQATFRSG
jgi:hypothetical protein